MDKSSDEALDNQPTAETQRNHNPARSSEERMFMGQPWGLANLFGIEMWERFSSYGMQAILVFCMYYETTQDGLGLDKGAATSIVGAHGGLVYMAALVASLVADRILDSEWILLYSAVLVMIGHISLAFIPGVTGLAIGLVSIVIGSGGVKINAQVVLGQLYTKDDPCRNAGFSTFYMGVDVDALFGPLLTDWVWEMKGFHWGFGLAVTGMAAGLVQYIPMHKSTTAEAGHDIPNPLPKEQYSVWIGIAVVITVVSVTLVSTGIVPVTTLSTVVTVIALIAAVVPRWQIYSSPLTTKSEETRLVGFIPVFASGMLFFGIFQQQFTVLAIYSDIRLDREIFGWEMSLAWINSIDPIFIIAFSMVFAAAWSELGDRQRSTPVKFGVANIVIGISLFFFIPLSGGGENSTPLYAIIWILFLFTIGELMLSPIDNALATKVAPAAFLSRMMAVWLVAVAMGISLVGTLAGFYNYEDAATENTFFITLGIASIVLGPALLALRKWIVKEFVDVR